MRSESRSATSIPVSRRSAIALESSSTEITRIPLSQAWTSRAEAAQQWRQRQAADIDSGLRVACVKCSAVILKQTSDDNNGLSTPCRDAEMLALTGGSRSVAVTASVE